MNATDDYLAELERRLAHADPSVREGLLEGIREELDALDEAGARERIRELGDPAHIAAEVSAHPMAPAPAAVRTQDRPWYSVVTVLLLAIGGWVVPVIGGIAGLVMLWMSRTWQVRHKVVGTLASVLSSPMLLGLWMILTFRLSSQVEPVSEVVDFVLLVALVVFWLGAHIWLLVVAARARKQ